MIGKMKRIATFYTAEAVRNGMGAMVRNYTEAFKAWVELVQSSNSARELGGTLSSVSTITLRGWSSELSEVKVGDRCEVNGISYEVRGTRVDDRKLYTTLEVANSTLK